MEKTERKPKRKPDLIVDMYTFAVECLCGYKGDDFSKHVQETGHNDKWYAEELRRRREARAKN